jgi:hypothetical protein
MTDDEPQSLPQLPVAGYSLGTVPHPTSSGHLPRDGVRGRRAAHQGAHCTRCQREPVMGKPSTLYAPARFQTLAKIFMVIGPVCVVFFLFWLGNGLAEDLTRNMVENGERDYTRDLTRNERSVIVVLAGVPSVLFAIWWRAGRAHSFRWPLGLCTTCDEQR